MSGAAPGRRGWLIVFLVTLAVWAPELRNDFVDWDDLNMIVRNPLFKPPTWSGVGWYWVHPAWNLYQPMTTSLWAFLAWAGWVNAPDQFGGHMNPAIFHLASMLLHALASVFLFQIVRRALTNNVAAVMAALLFAIHPLQAEPVAFAGTLNVPLSACLSLLAIWQYLLLTDPATELDGRYKIVRWIPASLPLVLAMLARPSAVACVPIALVLDLLIHRRGVARSISSSFAWVAIAIACMLWTTSIQHGSYAARSPVWFRPIVASDAVSFYLAKIFLPIHLCIEYDRTPQAVRGMRFCWFTPLVPISLIVAGLLLRRRWPLLTAAIVIFLTALLPNSGLMPFDWQTVSTVADRYAYLSMIGIALAGGGILQRWPALKFAGFTMLVLLAIRTEFQLATWRNGETLFRHALAENPDAWYSAGNLAVVIGDKSPDEAVALCRMSIRIRSDQSDVWNTLGSLSMGRGERSEAIAAFRTAHELEPQNPVFLGNLQRATAGR